MFCGVEFGTVGREVYDGVVVGNFGSSGVSYGRPAVFIDELIKSIPAAKLRNNLRQIALMIRLLVLIVVILQLPLAGEEMKHTTDPIEQVKTRVTAGTAVLIDVREQAEWDSGHLALAQHIPLSLLNQVAQIPSTLPLDRPIYLHCRSGGRSLKAAEILKAKGYDARPLEQGYGQLVDDGFATAK
jgi:phage shock protein E